MQAPHVGGAPAMLPHASPYLCLTRRHTSTSIETSPPPPRHASSLVLLLWPHLCLRSDESKMNSRLIKCNEIQVCLIPFFPISSTAYPLPPLAKSLGCLNVIFRRVSLAEYLYTQPCYIFCFQVKLFGLDRFYPAGSWNGWMMMSDCIMDGLL
jgi:hypothetical protein